MESFESTPYNKEIMMLGNYLEQEGIDQDDSEKVLEAAKALFGESRPEHEVEEVVSAFFAEQI